MPAAGQENYIARRNFLAHLELASKRITGRLLGSRQVAMTIRDKLEVLIATGDPVEVDFRNTNPTQSFVDELIGVLVLEHQRAVLSKIVFKNCSTDTRTILHLVVSNRLAHHSKSRNQDEAWSR